MIYPETMSFLEQVEAFHSSALVVGSSSSALSNALFCRPGCRILGLIHEELSFNFRGYTSFIEAGGHGSCSCVAARSRAPACTPST